METEKIYSERAEDDIWSSLLKFTYTENLKRYFEEKECDYSNDLLETISGSILQAYEYFSLSKSASLQVSPLLLYYGATNLLYGVSCLLTGKLLQIDNHGMKVTLQNEKSIAEAMVKFNNKSSGGISAYLNALEETDYNLTEQNPWTIKETLGSLVELFPDFLPKYGPEDIHVIPVKKVKSDAEENLRVDLSFLGLDQTQKLIERIPNFTNNYLHPRKNNLNELILRKKINGVDLYDMSYTGQMFMSIGHKKQSKNVVLPYYANIFIVLYSFSDLCRYSPEKWNPFVQKDTTGEKNLIEKFIYMSRRQLPNLMLNKIFNKNHLYSADIYKDIDNRVMLNKEEILSLIREEMIHQRGR